jgi:DNA-binding MarR family transcriptional regulator
MNVNEELLIALRQIIRAIDLHSKKLSKESGLTGPQLVVLQAVNNNPEVTPKKLSELVNLSQGTVTTIVDRLENRQYISKQRNEIDKRSWKLNLTQAGKALLAKAPTPLQKHFIEKFDTLEQWEQSLILSSVQRVAAMMNAEELDAAPLLEIGTITPEKVNEHH